MGCGSAKISNSNSRHPGAATTEETTALTEAGASLHDRRRSYGFLARKELDTTNSEEPSSPIVLSRSPITPHNEFATATSIKGSARIRVTLSRDGSVLQIETERLDGTSGEEDEDCQGEPQPSTSGLVAQGGMVDQRRADYRSRDYFSTSSSSSSSGTASLTSSGGCWPRSRPPSTIHASLQDLKDPAGRDLPKKHQSAHALRHSSSADEPRGRTGVQDRAGRTPIMLVKEEAEGDEGIDLMCEGGCEQCGVSTVSPPAAVAGIPATNSPACPSYPGNCDRLPGGHCDCSCDPGGGIKKGAGRGGGGDEGNGGARRKQPPPPRPPRPTMRPFSFLNHSDTHVPNHHNSLAHTRRRFQRQTSFQDNCHRTEAEVEAIVHSNSLPNGPESRFAKSSRHASSSQRPVRVNTSRSMPSALSSAASLDYHHRRNHNGAVIPNGGPINGPVPNGPTINGPTMNGSLRNGSSQSTSQRSNPTISGSYSNGAAMNGTSKAPARPPPPNFNKNANSLNVPSQGLSLPSQALSLPSPAEGDSRERSLEEFEGQRQRNPREEEEDYIIDAFDFAAALLPFVDSAVLEQAANSGDYSDPAIVLVTIHQDFFNDFGDYFDEDDIGGLEETHI